MKVITLAILKICKERKKRTLHIKKTKKRVKQMHGGLSTAAVHHAHTLIQYFSLSQPLVHPPSPSLFVFTLLICINDKCIL